MNFEPDHDLKTVVRNTIYRIRYHLSESYRIRVGRGLNPIRNKREMRALIRFCQEELKDKEHMKLNPDREELYRSTIALYGNAEKVVLGKDSYLDGAGRTYHNVFDIIEDHAGWYWS